MEQVFTICFTCFCKNFFLHERFNSEHLVATSTWFEVCRYAIQRNQLANGLMLKVYTKTYATKKNMYNFSAKHTWRSSKVLKHRKSGLTIIKSDSRVTC